MLLLLIRGYKLLHIPKKISLLQYGRECVVVRRDGSY